MASSDPQQLPSSSSTLLSPYCTIVKLDSFDSRMIRRFIGTSGNKIRWLEQQGNCKLSMRDMNDQRNKLGVVHVCIYAGTKETLETARKMVIDSVNAIRTQLSNKSKPTIRNTDDDSDNTISPVLKEIKDKLEWMENKLLDQELIINRLMENRSTDPYAANQEISNEPFTSFRSFQPWS